MQVLILFLLARRRFCTITHQDLRRQEEIVFRKYEHGGGDLLTYGQSNTGVYATDIFVNMSLIPHLGSPGKDGL